MAVVKTTGDQVTGGRTGAAVATVLGLLRRLVPHDPVDAGHAGDALLVADPLRQEPVPDLPGEHGGVLLLVLSDGVDNRRRGHLGLAATNHPGLEVPSLVIS